MLGHPRPLLLRGRKVVAESPAARRRCRSGSASGTPEPAGICELEPGDAVLLYTDGVVEARTPDGELFGLERLADLLEREAASGSGGPRNCCGGWSVWCGATRLAACAMTPRCCWCNGPAAERVGFQNSATVPGLGFYAARSYSLMRLPRTGRRWMGFRDRSSTG